MASSYFFPSFLLFFLPFFGHDPSPPSVFHPRFRGKSRGNSFSRSKYRFDLSLCASQATDEEKISVLLFRFFNSTLPSSRILREPEILREKIILKEGILERIFQMIHTVNKISFVIDNVADNRIL